MATPTNRDISTPIEIYKEFAPVWKKLRAVLGGERQVIKHDNEPNTETLLIPFSINMKPEHFTFFQKESELPGVCTVFARMLVNGLLRKSPVLELPESVPEEAKDWLMGDFGVDGCPLVTFLDQILWEEMNTSWSWIYIAHPTIADVNRLSAEDRAAISPYAIVWPAECVINVKTAPGPNGKDVLSRVLVSGVTEEMDPLSEFHMIQVPTIWVHEVIDGFYQVRVYKKPEEKEWMLADTLTDFRVKDQRITFIPAWPTSGNLEPVEPLLSTLVNKEVHLYNKISRRNHLLYNAATYTPVIISDMDDDKFEEIVGAGLGTVWKLPTGTTLESLSTPTEALKDMETTIAAGFTEMAKLGVRMLSPETEQSGIALEIRNASQTAQLGALNNRMSNTMRYVIAFMIQWKYGLLVNPLDINFKLTEDFNPIPLGDAWLRLATEWYEAGLIPRSIWLTLLKVNDLIDPAYDDELGRKEIIADPLINLTEPTSDLKTTPLGD